MSHKGLSPQGPLAVRKNGPTDTSDFQIRWQLCQPEKCLESQSSQMP